MDLRTFQALLTPLGQSVLEAAQRLEPTEETFLACLGRLKQAPTPLAKAALETVLLRQRAARKFTRARQMYFTREALEQATGEAIARQRAARFAGFRRVADLGCGLGGDTLALAEQVEVVALERDALRLRLAGENLRAYEREARAVLVQADLADWPLAEVPAFFFDPARRVGGWRRFSVQDYQPPLPMVHAWLERVPAAGVKISPGVDLDEVREYAAEIEFISEAGELKECVLWFGPLRSAPRRATLLPGPHTLAPLGAPAAPLSPPRAWLYEPDPAVLRAGLVQDLAALLGLSQLDPDIAYLTGDSLQSTPFARAFAIDEAFPFQLKRLRERLRALGVGEVVVKKRGSPLEPEQLIRQLKLSGPERRVVFLTHVAGRPYALIGRTP